jgi:hypothetical protein
MLRTSLVTERDAVHRHLRVDDVLQRPLVGVCQPPVVPQACRVLRYEAPHDRQRLVFGHSAQRLAGVGVDHPPFTSLLKAVHWPSVEHGHPHARRRGQPTRAAATYFDNRYEDQVAFRFTGFGLDGRPTSSTSPGRERTDGRCRG